MRRAVCSFLFITLRFVNVLLAQAFLVAIHVHYSIDGAQEHEIS